MPSGGLFASRLTIERRRPITPQHRRLLRAAVSIHKYATEDRASSFLPPPLPESLDALQRVQRRRQLAHQRELLRAAKRIDADWRVAVNRLRDDLVRLLSQTVLKSDRHVVNVRDIFADLVALESEFISVEVDLKAKTVTVKTDEVVLEDVFLGPFQIELDWTTLGGLAAASYRVIAVCPNPAASSEDVTHPHVQSESLCEGDGQHAIQAALLSGRLLDFFLLVANVLQTYNDSSPYVPLSQWDGAECQDCGYTATAEESNDCDRCGVTICDDCRQFCQVCDRVNCANCMSTCDGCDDLVCSECMATCASCDGCFCHSCLDPQHTRCHDCHENHESETTTIEERADATPTEPATAVQPDSVGQAAVPA